MIGRPKTATRAKARRNCGEGHEDEHCRGSPCASPRPTDASDQTAVSRYRYLRCRLRQRRFPSEIGPPKPPRRGALSTIVLRPVLRLRE